MAHERGTQCCAAEPGSMILLGAQGSRLCGASAKKALRRVRDTRVSTHEVEIKSTD